jgi:CO dehydrogenase maturation factor
VFNKYKTGTAPVDIGRETPIAILPDDPGVEAADLAATPVSQIPPDSPARIVVRELAENICSCAKKHPSA